MTLHPAPRMAPMCLHPLLQVPLTVQVSRQAIASDPAKAAADAARALMNLSETIVIQGGGGRFKFNSN